MQSYDMAKLATDLDFHPGLFLTREHGEQAFGRLKQAAKQLPEGDALLLIFPEGQLVDGSFADETIVRLGEELNSGQFGDRAMLLQGLTADSITNIEAVIGFRRLKLGFLAVESNGKWQVIGQLDPSLREMLALLAEQDCLTAPDLVEKYNLAINTASNRLKRLYDRRLVRREYEVSAKGLQYYYYFWDWQDVDEPVEA
jgi:hypothetical protein